MSDCAQLGFSPLPSAALHVGPDQWGKWHAVEQPTSSANPWTLQRRKSADGNTDAWFWSNFHRGKRSRVRFAQTHSRFPPRYRFTSPVTTDFPTPPHHHGTSCGCTAADDRVLIESPAPRKDTAQRVTWDLHEYAGQSGYIEAVDADTATAYAWIAFGRIDPPVVSVPAGGASVVARSRAAEIAEALHLTHVADDLRQMSEDAMLDADARATALLALSSFGDAPAVESLTRMLTNPDSPAAVAPTGSCGSWVRGILPRAGDVADGDSLHQRCGVNAHRTIAGQHRSRW